MKKGTPLPEEVIQHIQSFMNRKEAARSTLLSKSWYNAWLTRPTIDLYDGDFGPNAHEVFEEFAKKTMQRYQDLNLNIQSFKLRIWSNHYRCASTSHSLIVSAIKKGAIDLKLEFYRSSPPFASLPQEILQSKTLLRLSASLCEIDGDYIISCSRLKSLSLESVRLINSLEEFKNNIFSCCNSLEELSLSHCNEVTFTPGNLREVRCLRLSRENLNKLYKLTRLYFQGVHVDALFFTDFASRFPCLKDLTIHYCSGYTKIHIASTSLQTISFKPSSHDESYVDEFDVPNIQKFTYSVFGLPSQLSVNGALKEWESDISIDCGNSYDIDSCSWFQTLKRSLIEFRLSRISLAITLYHWRRLDPEFAVGIKVEAERTVVEDLMINAHSSLCRALLIGLFGICCPKFITYSWYGDWRLNSECLGVLYKTLMQKLITPNCGIPEQDIRQFGLKKVNIEVYEEFDTEWCPLMLEKPLDVRETPKNKRKVRFELIWD